MSQCHWLTWSWQYCMHIGQTKKNRKKKNTKAKRQKYRKTKRQKDKITPTRQRAQRAPKPSTGARTRGPKAPKVLVVNNLHSMIDLTNNKFYTYIYKLLSQGNNLHIGLVHYDHWENSNKKNINSSVVCFPRSSQIIAKEEMQVLLNLPFKIGIWHFEIKPLI